ncbi:hypothetical protein BGX30_011179, partial [Mortierella sp. GBA39]
LKEEFLIRGHLFVHILPPSQQAQLRCLATVAPPTTYFASVAYSLINILVPLTGQMGPSTPVDLIVPGLAGLVVFACSHILAFAHRFGRPVPLKLINALLVVQIPLFLYTLLVLTLYDHMHPKRMFVQHLRNTTTGETAVFLAHADQGAIYDGYTAHLEDMFGTKVVHKTSKEDKDDWNSVFLISEFIDSFAIDTAPYI